MDSQPRPADAAQASAPLVSATATPERLTRLAGRVTLAGDRDTLPVRTPFTGEVLGEVPLGTGEDIAEAARRGRAAQAAWRDLPFAQRAQVFLRFHDLILDRQAEVLDLIQLESGKSRLHAFEEVLDVAIVCRYYAVHGEAHLAPRRRRGALPVVTETWEYRHPRGLVGFIAPWNYPLTLGISDAVPALLAGNAVIIKPDRQTPFVTLWAVEMLHECGLPPDLLQVVTGSGATLGPPLIEACDYVGFTGSTETGRTVARQAGEALIGCSLELGGKNAMLVLDDADLAAAAREGVRGAFSNTGQLCISIERLFVQAGIYDRFVDQLVAETRALRLGASLDWEHDVGSLASQDQLDTVRAHVEDAVQKGARVLAGGRPRHDLGPLFWEPTVLAGVRPGMRVYDQETFGPVVSVYRFDTVDEAVQRANDTPYGLNAAVWTGSPKRGLAVAARLQAGTVNVNESYAATWASVDAPMGGFKDSGLGRRHGREGITKYTESQTIAVQRFAPIKPPQGVSHQRFAQVMTTALRVLKRLPGLR